MLASRMHFTHSSWASLNLSTDFNHLSDIDTFMETKPIFITQVDMELHPP